MAVDPGGRGPGGVASFSTVAWKGDLSTTALAVADGAGSARDLSLVGILRCAAEAVGVGSTEAASREHPVPKMTADNPMSLPDA
jgi:hypothetical protein